MGRETGDAVADADDGFASNNASREIYLVCSGQHLQSLPAGNGPGHPVPECDL